MNPTMNSYILTLLSASLAAAVSVCSVTFVVALALLIHSGSAIL